MPVNGGKSGLGETGRADRTNRSISRKFAVLIKSLKAA
jgi:hypothetical protein